jgi:hypothetical protein
MNHKTWCNDKYTDKKILLRRCFCQNFPCFLQQYIIVLGQKFDGCKKKNIMQVKFIGKKILQNILLI